MRITKDPEVRRQEIIDTAKTLFESKGIGKTAMTDIAAQAGVAKGLVYYYFSSKELLVSEVVEQFIKDLDQELYQMLRQTGLDFYGKLSAILMLYFKSFQNNSALLNLSPADPGVFSLIRDRMSAIALNHARDVLHQGNRESQIQIEHPEYMLKILISGLGDLYLEGVHDPQVHATLIEQTLGLEKGKLVLGN